MITLGKLTRALDWSPFSQKEILRMRDMLASSSSVVDNANASVFFSTATLLIGVLVTVVGAALTQVLLDAASADAVGRYNRLRNLVVLAAVILVDLWGVGFPLYALYRTALGTVTSALVTQVFISTLAVGVASATLPVFMVSTLYSVKYWFNLARLSLMQNDKRVEALRKMLIEGGYIEEARYDSLMLKTRAGVIDYESAVELLGAFSKLLILGKSKGFSSFFRTASYYYFQLVFVPVYARSFVRRNNITGGKDPLSEDRDLFTAPDSSNTAAQTLGAAGREDKFTRVNSDDVPQSAKPTVAEGQLPSIPDAE